MNHFMDRSLIRLYEAISRECSAGFDTYLLSDRTRPGFPPLFGNLNVKQFNFTLDDLESLGYPGKQNLTLEHAGKRNMKLGNSELPILLFKAAHPEYEHYWIVEYDVRFSGSWNMLFTHFSDSVADLLGTTLTTYPEFPGWSHWANARIPSFRLSQNQFMRGFFPFYRISGRALECLHQNYLKGCSGHMEVLVPTLVFHSGLRLEDIGGTGKFVSNGNENRFYTNNPTDNTLAPGTFVYRPWSEVMGEQPNMLWHPVKTSPSRLVTLLKECVKHLLVFIRKVNPRK